MEISFQLTEQDYFEYTFYSAWKAPWNKMRRLSYYLKSAAWGIVFIAIILYGFQRDNLINFISTLLVYFIIYSVLIYILIKDGYRRATRKIYNDPKNASLFGLVEVSINETGISAKTEVSDGHHNWSAIIRSSSTKNLYILYLSEITALIIPKRVLKTLSEKESFEKMLSQYLPLQADLPLRINNSFIPFGPTGVLPQMIL